MKIKRCNTISKIFNQLQLDYLQNSSNQIKPKNNLQKTQIFIQACNHTIRFETELAFVQTMLTEALYKMGLRGKLHLQNYRCCSLP